mmetsp:Transcript_7808/g.16952  ORF Transcript_7808/g.16952 Transcript_7808/m.16952 type:complete len:555 (+) Transcript_7808:472-2136(+)
MGLEALQELRAQVNIARLVDAVHVAEGRGDGEFLGNGGERLPDLPHVLRRRVELVLRYSRVVHTVLHTSSNTDLHLEDKIHRSHPLQVLPAKADVLFVVFLRKIQHVTGEERLTRRLEVVLVVCEHAVKPRQQLLRAVIRVHEDGNAVGRGHAAHIVRAADGSQDGCLLLVVWQALPCEEGRATLGELNHDGPVQFLARLKDSVHAAGARAVEGGDRKTLGLGETQECPRQVAREDACLHPWYLPEALHNLHLGVHNCLGPVVRDAVLVAQPSRARRIHHGGGAVVGAAHAAQAASHHWRASFLGRGENDLLRSADEVHAYSDARLPALVDREDRHAIARSPDLLLVRVKAADVAVLAGTQKNKIYGRQPRRRLCDDALGLRLKERSVGCGDRLRRSLPDLVDLALRYSKRLDEVLQRALVALAFPNALVTEEHVHLAEVEGILGEIGERCNDGAAGNADGEGSLRFDGGASSAYHLIAHSFPDSSLVFQDLHDPAIREREVLRVWWAGPDRIPDSTYNLAALLVHGEGLCLLQARRTLARLPILVERSGDGSA